MINSFPLVDFTKKDLPPIRTPNKKSPLPPQKLTLRLKNNIKKNKAGSVSLLLDLVALILIVIFLNSFPYAGTFAILALVCSYSALSLEWDDKPKLARYGFLIGVILLVIILLPLIFTLIRLFFYNWSWGSCIVHTYFRETLITFFFKKLYEIE